MLQLMIVVSILSNTIASTTRSSASSTGWAEQARFPDSSAGLTRVQRTPYVAIVVMPLGG